VPDQNGQPPTPETVAADLSQMFDRRTEVGEDLMRITVGDTITVQRSQPR